MTNPVALLGTVVHSDGPQTIVKFWCPGCSMQHRVGVGGVAHEGLPNWTWDGRLDRPSFEPSILCYSSVHICAGRDVVETCTDAEFEACGHHGHRVRDDGTLEVFVAHTADPAYGSCHSFLRDGVWDFLGDCAHALAGQKVPMVPVPDWMMPR